MAPGARGHPPDSGHNQRCGFLGKAVAVLVLGLGGDTQAVPPSCARPEAPWCLLSVLLAQNHPGSGWFSCCRGIWAPGTGGQRSMLHRCCLHLPMEQPRAGLAVQLGFPWGCGLWSQPRHRCWQ